jgi:hypothetical protein
LCNEAGESHHEQSAWAHGQSSSGSRLWSSFFLGIACSDISIWLRSSNPGLESYGRHLQNDGQLEEFYDIHCEDECFRVIVDMTESEESDVRFLAEGIYTNFQLDDFEEDILESAFSISISISISIAQLNA